MNSVRRKRKRASVERAVKGYYDSLSGEEATELSKWGEFALQEFPR